MSKRGKRSNSLNVQVLKGKRVLAEWEKELLRATRTRASVKIPRKLREARRLRISEAARRNGLTYNQFVSAARHYDPTLGGTVRMGDMTPAELDLLAGVIKANA